MSEQIERGLPHRVTTQDAYLRIPCCVRKLIGTGGWIRAGACERLVCAPVHILLHVYAGAKCAGTGWVCEMQQGHNARLPGRGFRPRNTHGEACMLLTVGH